MTAIEPTTAAPFALFDSHCHLDLPEFSNDWQATWRHANAVGVKAVLIPAVEEAAWPRLLQFKQQPAVEIALGIHPWWARQHTATSLSSLETLLNQHMTEVCAIGEIGLDFALEANTFKQQEMLFSGQLALAETLGKPVILHHRKSMPALLAEIKRQKFRHGGILHAFSGSAEQGMAFIELGFKLGIGGTITYPRSRKTQAAVARLPLSAFVIETDAPTMPLHGFQGQRNEPAQLPLVFAALCALRTEPPAFIAEQLWQNTRLALKLSPSAAN